VNRSKRRRQSGHQDSTTHREDDSTRPVAARRLKWIASAAILFHLSAVVLPPLAFQTRTPDGPSPLFGTLIRPFSGYGQFLHLDRGYAFFAPDPGPSHLIQAAITQPDGTVTEVMFPDRDRQWPRLLYHRHFMLSEYLHETYWPPGPPTELSQSDPQAAALWQQRRGRYEYVRKSMIDHLQHVNEGRSVAIRRIEHGLPAMREFLDAPIPLDDERLYNVLLDQPPFDDRIAPPGAAEEIPADALVPAPANDPSERAAVERTPGTRLSAEPRSAR
jgi:hypothetical protein